MYYNGMRINHLTVQKIQIRGFEMRRLHHKYCTLNRSTAVAVLVVVHRYIFIGLGLFFFFLIRSLIKRYYGTHCYGR